MDAGHEGALLGVLERSLLDVLVQGDSSAGGDVYKRQYVYDGAMAGTEGECKRMESIRMKLPSSVNSSIQYLSLIHI